MPADLDLLIRELNADTEFVIGPDGVKENLSSRAADALVALKAERDGLQVKYDAALKCIQQADLSGGK